MDPPPAGGLIIPVLSHSYHCPLCGRWLMERGSSLDSTRVACHRCGIDVIVSITSDHLPAGVSKPQVLCVVPCAALDNRLQ